MSVTVVGVRIADGVHRQTVAGRNARCAGRFPLIPVIAKQLDRMLRPVRTVAASHGVGRAVLITTPAIAFRVRGVNGEFLGHGNASNLDGLVELERMHVTWFCDESINKR